MHIGWRRFREAAAPIVAVGVVGTFLTVAAGRGAGLHAAFGLPWYAAVLVATAVAPTDPAVVFSVLGQREVAGRSGTILEGESGANDPVGIALLASLLAAGGLSRGRVRARRRRSSLVQMAVGAAIGVAGGRGAAVVHPAGRRCRARGCTRCGPWPARCCCTRWPRWPTARGSWPCSSPGS